MKKELLLVFNAGSSSLKVKAFTLKDFEVVFDESFDIHEKGKERVARQKELFDMLIKKAEAIGFVVLCAHRIVHGGPTFFKPTVMDKANLTLLESYNDLAPLHNPFAVDFIKLITKYFPKIPNVAVFDTGFYADLPEVAKIFPIPYEYYEKNIRRYGAHGTSHQYVLEEAAKELKKSISKCNIISLHLGGGSSITAVKNGKAIDTSMGFSPLGGIMMMTRTGDIDPSVLLHLMKKHHIKLDEMTEILNHKSGIFGLSNVKDFRELVANMEKGDKKCKLAFDLFVYRIIKHFGSYYAILGGKLDAVVFTGGIGSGSKVARKAILADMKFLKGIPVLTIKTNEELAIAKQAKKVLAEIK